MQLKMNDYQLPDIISFNYEELKAELESKVKMYEGLVYTDDQITEAKKDKANLNKLKKALNDERIRLQKEYLEPFNKFKAQIDEIISIIDKPVLLIDKQVKEAEEVKKREKLEAIKEYYSKLPMCEAYQIAKFEMIFDEKWLNASVSMKSIQTQIQETLAKIEQDIATLQNLPEFAFEAIEEYKTSLNLSKAIQEGQRLADIQRRKQEKEAEQARLKAEAELAQHMNPPVEAEGVVVNSHIPSAPEDSVEVPQRQWISFKANLTVEEAHQLKNFFEARKIEYAAI